MATTLVNIVQIVKALLEGAIVGAAGAVSILNPKDAKQQELAGAATRLDYFLSDLSQAGYAKNGGAVIPLTGTTPVNVDLTDLTAGATIPTGGDTTFATLNHIVIKNLGAADLTLAPGGSNPARFPTFAGTTPTLTIPAGSTCVFQDVAGLAVDGTHKVLTLTPTAGGSVSICVGGA